MNSGRRSQDDRAWDEANRSRERANWDTLARAVSDITFQARQQGLLDSQWKVYLFGSEDPADLDLAERPYMTLDPSGRWQLRGDGTSIYASSERPGICRTTNAIVCRVRFALIEALGHG